MKVNIINKKHNNRMYKPIQLSFINAISFRLLNFVKQKKVLKSKTKKVINKKLLKIFIKAKTMFLFQIKNFKIMY